MKHLVTAVLAFSLFAVMTGCASIKVVQPEMVPSYKRASQILGIDFITPGEAALIRKLSYTNEQMEYFMRTLPNENTLRWLKTNNYALVPGPPKPMGLVDVYFLKPKLFFYKMSGSRLSGWFLIHPIVNGDKAETEWLAIRKEEVQNSVNKFWRDQLKLFSEDERVPNAGEMSWFITTLYEVRRTYLLQQVYVRTSSVTSPGRHIVIGFVGSHGLDVWNTSDGSSFPRFGIAVARKL